jgi:hypothetical protein
VVFIAQVSVVCCLTGEWRGLGRERKKMEMRGIDRKR